MSRLTAALACAPGDDCPECGTPPTQDQTVAVLALIQSDEARKAIKTSPCIEGGGCGRGSRKHPDCAQAALIAYLTADSLTKGGE